MAKTDSDHILIQITGLNPFELKLKDKAEARAYKQAEKMLNDTLARYSTRFKQQRSREEIMAMVAFKFAWSVVESNTKTVAVDDFLKNFEQQLDEIILKL